jgi:hypothetical protein
MKHSISFFLALMIFGGALAQSQNRALSGSLPSIISDDTGLFSKRSIWGSFFSRDKQVLYRPKSIQQIVNFTDYTFKSGTYWMGSITTQSFNKGKLGRYYMWDVQGNLQESRMFLDVAGKNKRGLKLVFQRR